ncbi:unnamed protein product [Eruca vesicaria subsp. sativa]|uniref:Uncharacterized protein n=1 Tax=Eruca vesicaria subsp. sativa TaxID=29727 RepID=A0ABC8JMC4_ERUVS|nr:unnamed protein product [Eruca vesicaria subsp. sativa]
MRFDGKQVPGSNQETEPVSVPEKDNFWENALFNRGEDGDDHGNRSSFTNGETDLNHLPAIQPVSNGQGLPFAPTDFPSPGDV